MTRADFAFVNFILQKLICIQRNLFLFYDVGKKIEISFPREKSNHFLNDYWEESISNKAIYPARN